MNVAESERAVDNVKLFKAVSDYSSVIYDQALSLQTSILNIGELCLILKELQQPLKYAYAYANKKAFADKELEQLLQKLFVALQNVKVFVIERAQIQCSGELSQVETECVPYFKRLEEKVSALIVYLRRIGVYVLNKSRSESNKASPWVYRRPTHEAMTKSLWPMIFLPDRNLIHIGRPNILNKIVDILTPQNKPHHLCIVSKDGLGGMGRTETLLEAAYQCLEHGVFGVVVWIPCSSESSVSSTFRYLALRIVHNDPSFALDGMSAHRDQGLNLSTLDRIEVVTLVVQWLEKLPMPYLLVYDNADDPSFLPPSMFPKAGQGTIVLNTLSLHLSSWRNTLHSRPKVVELSSVDVEEGLLMAEQGLSTLGKVPKGDLIDLMKYFDYSPVHFACALNTINCWRNRSFVEIGPRDYLNRIARDVPTLLGHSVQNATDGADPTTTVIYNRPAMHGIISSQKSVLIRLQTAADFTHSSKKTLQRIMDLICFLSCDGVDLQVLYDWIRPSYCPLPIASNVTTAAAAGRASDGVVVSASVMRVHISYNKALLGERSMQSSEESEFIVTVSSLLPRRLKTSGEYSYEWVVYRRHADLEYFFNTVKVKCSKKLQQVAFPPLQSDSLLKPQVNCVNDVFMQLCNDPSWPLLCDDDMVRKFFNIHTSDFSETQVTERMMGLLQPLVAVGILRVQHRLYGNSVFATQRDVLPSTEEDEDDIPSTAFRRSVVMLGTHSSVQEAVLYGIRQEKREDTVAQEVIRFLIGYFRHLEVAESAPMEDTWIEEGVSRESLLPHVERAVTLTSTDLHVCLELCFAAHGFAVDKQVYNTAHVLATRALDIVVTLAPPGQSHSEDIAFWRFSVAHCSLKQGKYSEASVRYFEALQSIQEVSLHPDTDAMIATIYSELAETCEKQGNFHAAEQNLRAMVEIWQHCLLADPKNELCLNEVVLYYHKMSVVKDLQHDYAAALSFSSQAIDAAKALRGGTHTDIVDAFAHHAALLVKTEKLDDAISVLEDALRMEQNLLRRGVPRLYVSISQCYMAQAKYISAEETLYHALDVIDKLSVEKVVIEERAEVLSRLSEALIEQGKYDDAVQCTRDAYTIWKRLYGENSEKTALALCGTGKLLKALARYTDAAAVFLEALAISDKCLRNEAIVEALNNLAEMCSAQSKYSEAESYLLRALNCLREAHYDATDRKSVVMIANQLCALAELKKELLEFERSRELFEEALLLLRSVFGSQHAQVAHVLELLADLFSDRGEERVAKIHRSESIRIYRLLGQEDGMYAAGVIEETTGAIDASVSTSPTGDAQGTASASALGSLAALLSAEERFDEAAPMLEKAVALLTNQYGENHPRIAMALNNLAKVLKTKGRLEQAQAMHERALAILRKVHGDNHPHVATAMHNLGALLAQQGKNNDAIAVLHIALERRRMVFGDEHVHIAETLKILGHLYYLESDCSQARTYLNECLAIRRKICKASGDRHFVAISLNNKGLVLKNMLMHREAEEALRESLSIRQEMFAAVDPKHPSIATGYNTLGKLLMAMGRYQESRDCLEKALTARQKNYGQVHISIANTLNSLSELSYMEGRLGEAAILMQRVVDMRVSLSGEGSAVTIANLTRLISMLRTTGNDVDAAKAEVQLGCISDGNASSSANTTALALVLDAFEEDEDSTTHFLRMDTGSGGGVARPAKDEKIGYCVEGGPGWPERLLAKLIKDRDMLMAEVREGDNNIATTKNNVDNYLRRANSLREEIESKTIKVKYLTTLVTTDKRYQYDLDKINAERAAMLEELGLLESGKEKDAIDDLKQCEENLSKMDMQLQTVSAEISILEDVNARYRESEKVIVGIEDNCNAKSRTIERVRWELVQSDGSDEAQTSALHSSIRTAISEKSALEVDRELAEVVHRKIINELDVIRIRHHIAHDVSLSAKGKTGNSSSMSAQRGLMLNDISDDDMDDDDNNDGEGDIDGDEGTGEANTSLKKRIKKQRMLIDILTNQVVSLGVEPIAEVVTFPKAEQRLQSALVRLMEGDEEAAKDFDKWDQFVRNHPEYKVKEVARKLKWTRENLPINAAALRHIRGLVPPSIVSGTLSMLEEKLPPAIAKRVWSKKALWLTRIAPNRIGRLHIADLQTKYSTQGLDEIELRAVFASLPDTFENDGKGDKAAWKDGVLQSLQSKCKQELPWAEEVEHSLDIVPSDMAIADVIEATARNACYRNIPVPLPFDPDEAFLELDEVSHKDDNEQSAQMQSNESATETRGDSTTAAASSLKKEDGGAPSRSILRRASLFGSQSKGTIERANTKVKRTSSESTLAPDTRRASSGGMGGLLAEMKLEAAKKQRK